jgi:exodeoxyribonuclease VII large subunit
MSLNWGPERRVLTVSELNAHIRALLDEEFGDVWIAGEVSGCRPATSGHIYFTLKDRDSQLKCVVWRSTARYLKFRPQDGIAVIARGRIDVFEPRGEYQLIVDVLQPQGHGALQLAFEQLKKKLAAEGLFDAERKRPLPKLPRRIGLITSPTGAVIQDMLNVLTRRFPGLHIRLYPVQVQGEGSVESVCRGLEYFSGSGWADVVILARGGGSLEDLWTFNEEAVVRAIAASQVPVVSAVGHETDFTIADFVADLRAPTPSAAAELVVGTREGWLEIVINCEKHLDRSMRFRLSEASRRLHQQGIDRAVALLHRRVGRGLQAVDELDRAMRETVTRRLTVNVRKLQEFDQRLRRTDMRLKLAQGRARIDALEQTAGHAVRDGLRRSTAQLEPLAEALRHLSPLTVLDRGYSIVQTRDGTVVRSPAQAPPSTALRILTAGGHFEAVATEPPERESG